MKKKIQVVYQENPARANAGSAILPLTGIRFVAALIVAVCHFQHAGLLPIPVAIYNYFDGGRPAVTLFFILSGFILSHTYYDRLGTASQLRAYGLARFARIYPVHLLALVLGAVGVLIVIKSGNSERLQDWYAITGHRGIVLTLSLITQLLVITAWIPAASIELPWNGPAWSISCEWFFYAVLPLMLPLVKRLSVKRLLVATVLGWVSQGIWLAALQHFLPPIRSGLIVYQFPPTHLFEFALGISSCVLYRHGLETWLVRPGHSFAFVLTAVLALSVISYRPLVTPASYLMSPAFALLILGLSSSRDPFRILSNQAVLLLGQASFSLYLIHVPLMRLALIANASAKTGPFILVAVIGLSIVVFLLFEEPSRRFLRFGGMTRYDLKRLQSQMVPAEGIRERT